MLSPEVNRLSRALSGHVAEAGSDDYHATMQIDNGRVRLPPALVVYPRSAEDVGLAIRFAREHDLPFTVKGGGHSAAGYALNRAGVVLDMSSMADKVIDLDHSILHVQMGARWSDVYRYVVEQDPSLLPIGGGCLTVGLPGFLLGGGYSFSSRSYGMGSDNVLSIDFVTPDGCVHHLSADSEDPVDQELWWACRGGGGGSFGVAVSMVLQLQRPATKMLVGEIHYRLSDAAPIIEAYNEWIETLPDSMACYGALRHMKDPGNPDQNVRTFGITPVFNGPYEEGMEILAPMLKFAALEVGLYEMTLPEFEEMIGKGTLVGDRQAYIRSGIMRGGAMTAEVAEIYQRFMESAPSEDSFVVWTHGGGRIEEIDSSESAVAHRDGRFIFELKAIWSDPNDMRANVQWAYEFLEALRPHFIGAYVNYIDPLLTDWKQMYFGDNYDRLEALKHHVDPDGFFMFQQAIGSDFEPSGDMPLDLSPLNRTIV